MTIDKNNLMGWALLIHIIQVIFTNPEVIISYGMIAISIYYVITISSKSYRWIQDRLDEGY